jgi:hypothetical protein
MIYFPYRLYLREAALTKDREGTIEHQEIREERNLRKAIADDQANVINSTKKKCLFLCVFDNPKKNANNNEGKADPEIASRCF